MTRIDSFPLSYSTLAKEASVYRLALLEDSISEAAAVRALLEPNGFSIHLCSRGGEFLALLQRDSFDTLILDWSLPDMTGFDVLRRLREEFHCNTPVLMLTARTDEFSLVEALSFGADDYVAKPWRPRELLARLKVLTRTTHGTPAAPQELLTGWMFDRQQQRVTCKETQIKLPLKQFEVARLLFEQIGRPVSREHLNQLIWHGRAQARTVDTHVSAVRSRLKLTPANGFQLHSIYGFGYRLDRLHELP